MDGMVGSENLHFLCLRSETDCQERRIGETGTVCVLGERSG